MQFLSRGSDGTYNSFLNDFFCVLYCIKVGYGDITPRTDTGKIFATIYVLVAGTVLLHNMSLISMIPLEFRKRRIERAVLMQVMMELHYVHISITSEICLMSSAFSL